MSKHLMAASVLAGLFVVGCEKRPESPGTGTPTPESTPVVTPQTSPTAQASPTVSPGTPTPAETPLPSPASTTSPSANSQVQPGPSVGTASGPSETQSEPPKLSSPSANEYLQCYDAYIRELKSASQAMKQGDVSKYRNVIQRALDLQSKSEKLSGELNPEEEQRFANYLQIRENELAAFAGQNR